MHIPSFKLISQSMLKKSPENSDGRTDGRTDGQTDGHCHSIIRLFFKRVYKNGFLYVFSDDQSIDITVKWHYSYCNSCVSHNTWTEAIIRETLIKSSDVGWLICLNVKSIHTFTPVYLKIAIYRQTQHAVHKCQSYMLPLYQSYR